MRGGDLTALRDRAERAAADALACIAPSPPDRPAAQGPSGATRRDESPGGTTPRGAPGGSRSPVDADPALLDRFITELDELETALAAAVPDGDVLLRTVRARLGGLYAERYGRNLTDEDRARGLRVLRAARASGALGPREDRAAAFHLVRLLLTPSMAAGWDGTLDRLLESFDLGRRVASGDRELTADLAELCGLLTELAPTLPEDVAASLSWVAETLERVPAVMRARDFGQMAELATQMAQRMPGRGSELMRALSALVAEFSVGGAAGDGGEAEPDEPEEPDDPLTDPAEEEVALFFAQAALMLELEAPGTIRTEDLDALVDQVSKGPAGEEPVTAMRAAMSRMAHGVRTGDADRLAEAAELMDTVTGAGSGRVDWMAGVISPGLLAAANAMGGNLTDRDQARARLDMLFGPASAVFDSAHATGPGAEGLRICTKSMHLQLRLNEALEERDAEALEELLDELLDLLEGTDESSEWQFLVLSLLGLAQLSLALLDAGVPALRAGVAYFEEAANHPRLPAFAQPFMDACCAPLLALFSVIEPDPVRVSDAVARARRALDGPASTPDQRIWIRQGIGQALLSVHRSTGDRADLEEAVGELEQARRELTERTGPAVRQKVLWELAEAYRLRDDRERDDTGAAVAAAHASLWVLAEDVLLQLGAEHGLEVARAGASRGLLAAHWAAVDGRIEEAVESLENGRGLVLRAAAAAAGIPEQLAARGEAELAERWRTAVRDLPPPTAPTGLGDGSGTGTSEEVRNALARVVSPKAAPGIEIPSTLRRRALDVLRRDSGEAPLRGLLGAPGVAELRKGLRATGADALVYLMPGRDSADGAAVLVRGAGEPVSLPLQGLGAPGREPLERYLDAGARRSAAAQHGMDAYDEAHRQWEAALEALCDWAGPAVLQPVLAALGVRTAEDGNGEQGAGEHRARDDAPGEHKPRDDAPGAHRPEEHQPRDHGTGEHGPGGPDAPVRLVLVPCGNLGVVPWHAARLPGPRTGARRPYSYACQSAVISYAASGGEFLRAARRGRMPADERVVLVADPSGDLTWAQEEVAALHTAYYPEALLYGEHEDAPEDAPGTPEDVLSHLPGGAAAPAASLLHLVVHGLAGLRPTDSALHLAAPETDNEPQTGSAPETHGDPGAGSTGRLTVTHILNVPTVPAAPTVPGAPAVPAGDRTATGPLIVLSACETDLSSRDHDEALTPTTALLARGATDVVGSRWKVPDSASAALMVVFHHHLTVTGLAPPDALRAAQLWMLDQDRHPVPGLTGLLLAETQSDVGGLARVISWAGFIHQGNPAPHAPAEGRQP
ncbi:CHAT domain-containing protein [Streptomyces hygroscopicus]|uniref:CHAT domain-containing protein n=1 Tax=Streptomyces hygroscopicus TaxID=1912 RepID=UPI0005616EC2|nr:CHAT domain-containing protein [Streptomyces hygroscopicus]